MSRCCRCGCDKINFKVFQFSDGTLLWERLTIEPTVATNGDVYEIDLTEVTCHTIEWTPASQGGTISFNDGGTETDNYLVKVRRLDGSDGSEIGLSPVLKINPKNLYPDQSLSSTFLYDYLIPSHYRINGSGELVHNITPWQWTVHQRQIDSTTDVYYFEKTEFVSDDITLTMDSTGTPPDTHSAAVFDASASAATIESTIQTAFGTNVVSVTVTGDSFATSFISIEIEWATANEYLDTVTYPTRSSELQWRLMNARTGIYSTNIPDDLSTSSWHRLGPIWKDDGTLFMVGCKGPETGDSYDATVHEVKSWDPSTNPWTLDWSHRPYIGYQTGINGDHAVGGSVLDIGSKNGRSFATYAISAVHDDNLWPPRIDGNFSTWHTYTDAGVWSDNRYGFSSINQLNVPAGVAVEDSGTRVAIIHTQSIARWDWEDTSTFQPVTYELYGQAIGNQCRIFQADTATIDNEICRGDHSAQALSNGGAATSNQMVGCNATAVAFCDFNNIIKTPGTDDSEAYCSMSSKSSVSTTDVNTDDGIATFVGPTYETNIVHSVNLYKIRYSPLRYTLYTGNNAMADSSTEWRIRFTAFSSDPDTGVRADFTTAWFNHSTTVADVNTELASLIGNDADGNQIFTLVDTGATSDSSLPVWNTWVTLESFMARTQEDDWDEAGLPYYLSTSAGTPNARSGHSPRITIEFQTFGDAITKEFGALSWTDGTEIWARNFGKGDRAKGILRAQLHDGRLHVLSNKQCNEIQPSELLLDIALTSDASFGSTFDITVTLNITNNTGGSLIIDTNDVTTASGTIVWNAPTSVTLADGESGSLIGTINVSAGTHDFSGTVGDSSGPVTSNTDSESITV
jgi:hypothetical protein